MIRNIPSSVIAQAATTNGVPVADITVIPNRMRRLRPEVVNELAELIAAQGLLHPITLRKRASDGAHVLVAGLRRALLRNPHGVASGPLGTALDLVARNHGAAS